ncbi:helix-turn-helix domain-containing protein [Companilactobacillus kimchiensis]|uniref:HTH cro/C1-type domain-containing protein n=1 Tax=Companilactobacillus kimchiensis TaxID=993692 RepID=A0A0R2LAP3_9LACO|nr:helix-turn-helix transcriptional regulator [Companilactobacillus kimchiensis]KRN98888.1 hypothetical protein IV57_GL000698 [Companilactobacillus kimchiensis]
MKIGDQLQRQRKLHQMSQNDLADKLHLSRQSISKWENGTTLPSFANVIAISELLDVSLDELIKGDEALMDKFNNDDKIRLSKTETIYVVGFILVVIILGIIYSLGIPTSSVDDWMSSFSFVFFIGFISNIKWSIFNKSLNKWAVVFGILMLVAIMVPSIMHEIPDFLKGITDGIRSGYSYK